ncbi:hypothetical protein XU18_2115 [Perkinsela sp. CCAP 1560/4]|nr:hypothetical protein XU18_2115 [Perkinsela sp. CCAP 1560/4]|eukprot:KNH07179.1 hypothetical protein XU18_2115 [Perkinsela sp. CCAP 1560/4]
MWKKTLIVQYSNVDPAYPEKAPNEGSSKSIKVVQSNMVITQIFVGTDMKSVIDKLNFRHPLHKSFELQMIIQIQGYTIGSLIFPNHGHLSCRVPVQAIDSENIKTMLFCRCEGQSQQHAQASLRSILTQCGQKTFSIEFVGFNTTPSSKPSLRRKRLESQAKGNPVLPVLCPLSYYGIQLQMDTETQAVYDESGKEPLGIYNAKHSVVISSLE